MFRYEQWYDIINLILFYTMNYSKQAKIFSTPPPLTLHKNNKQKQNKTKICIATSLHFTDLPVGHASYVEITHSPDIIKIIFWEEGGESKMSQTINAWRFLEPWGWKSSWGGNYFCCNWYKLTLKTRLLSCSANTSIHVTFDLIGSIHRALSLVRPCQLNFLL